jgi:DNA repair exonuclease SbcCD ATPase subunit
MVKCHLGRGPAGLIIAIAGFIITGCDYWPPALQAQIEQLQLEAQVAVAERTRLQSQLTEAAAAKDELQSRVEELNRVNRELSGKVSTLEHALAVERTKVRLLTKSAPPVSQPVHKTGSKPTMTKKKPTRTAKKSSGRVDSRR